MWIDVTKCRTVGIGSVCRRQATTEAVEIIESLYNLGINIHGFGFKIKGLAEASRFMKSSDSMAWSIGGRKDFRDQNCPDGKKNCGNCLHYAVEWREKVLRAIKIGMKDPIETI